MNCPHHDTDKGICKIATAMSNFELEIPVELPACAACRNTDKPMDMNAITCGMAYGRLIAAGKRDIAISNEALMRCLIPDWNPGPINLKGLPGYCLYYVLKQIGISRSGMVCGCHSYANQMNSWGVAGCEARINEIVAHLNSQEYTWREMFLVAKAGFFTTKRLVKHAIRKAKSDWIIPKSI